MKKLTTWSGRIFFIIMMGFITSCTSDFEGPFPETKKKPTVNATLAADSLIKIGLSWPRSPGDTNDFRPITNAQISLWKNDSLLGQPQEKKDGSYLLQHRIKAGCTYKMEAAIEDHELVSAETYVPHNINSSVTEEENPHWEWEGDKNHYRLTLGKAGSETAGIWLTATLLTKNSIPTDQAFEIASNTLLADNFNKAYDATAAEGYFSLYENFMRIHPENLQSDSTSLTFKPNLSRSGEGEFIFILTAAKVYDRYFRALWRDKTQNASNGVNAFTYHPQFPYSNIKNGYGIFAGYNIQRFHF